jgi:hypothetical protein
MNHYKQMGVRIMNLVDCIHEGVVALYPFYGDQGENATLIRLKNTTITVDCAISSVLSQFANCYDKTLENIRRTASQVTGYGQYHPLYFCRSMILFPVKHRKSYGRRDGSMAYINHVFVREVLGTTQKATIYFISELPPYPCPFARASTVRNRLVLADALISYYKQLGA